MPSLSLILDPDAPGVPAEVSVKTIDISLGDLFPETERAGQEERFRGGLPITIELDEPGDVDAAQTAYLEGYVLRRRAAVEDPTFRFRFQYDLHGTAHWDGKWFILDVAGGECVLRLAGLGDYDESDGRVYKRDRGDLREAIAVRRKHASDFQKGRRTASPRSYSMILDVSWRNLTGKDLKQALDQFRVAEVMLG